MMMTPKDEEVKTAIIEAAARVFKKWGLNKTTMEDIAQDAGKGKSTLYYYFKSKEELFEILASREIALVLQRAKESIENIGSARQRLRRFVATTLIELKKTAGIYPIIKGELRGNRVLIDKIGKYIDDEEEKLILDILEQGRKSKEFHFLNDDNIKKAAVVIVGIMRGMALYLFLETDDSEQGEIVARLLTDGL